MAALSDQLLAVAVLTYLVAMICHAVEYSLGAKEVRRRAAAPARELVSVGADAGPEVENRPEPPADLPPATSAAAGRAVLAGRAAIVVTVVAALVHAAATVTRAIAADRMPWGNMYEFVLSVTLVGVVGWLLVLRRHPSILRLGLLVTLAMVLLLGAAGLIFNTPIMPLMPALNSYWYIIHVSTIMLSSGILLLGVVPALMYLLRAGYERGKRGFPYMLARRVPAAATLERLTFRLHAFAFPIFTFAIIAGAIWAEAAWGRAWGWDPKETWAFISWVVYAGYLHARATPSVKRSTATWIAILGFLTMLMNLYGVNLFFVGLHSYA